MHPSPLVLAAGFVLAVSACSSDETTLDTQTDTTTTVASVAAAPSTTTMPEPTTTTSTIPADEPAAVALSSATYGHVVFTVNEARYSNATPGTFLDDAPKPGDDRYLYVSFSADYEPDYPGRSDGFQAADFALHLGDGTVIPSAQVDFRRTLRVSVDAPLEHAWAFEGGSFDLSDASIVYDDATHLPVTLTLGANAPASRYPIPFVVDESGDISYDGGCTTGAGVVRVLDGEWDVDGGVDHDGRTMVNAGTARTVDDERFVRLRVQAIAESGNCGGTVLTDDAFRLIVDGLPLGSINSHASKLDDGEGVELIFAYRVPVEAAEIAFEAGISGEVTQQFEIEVPDLSP